MFLIPDHVASQTKKTLFLRGILMSLSPKKINAQNLAETVIRNLSKCQIAGYYAQDKDEALEIACRFLQPGSTVSWRGSMTLN